MHLFMSFACISILVLSELGFWLTKLTVSGVGWSLAAAFVVAAVVLPVAAFLHEKGRSEWRDNVLVIPWCIFLGVLTPLPVLVAARLRMPFCDALFEGLERAFGLSTVSVMRWTGHPSLNWFFHLAYNQTLLFLILAIFLPPAMNKRESKVFVLANAIALFIGVFCFAIFPVIGPWRTENFAPSPLQVHAQQTLLALRSPGKTVFSLSTDQVGIVGFPSFHAVWAVLCAAAFWGFKRLRPLLVLVSVAIAISTITTGWHYILDTAGGIATAFLSLLGAKIILGPEAQDPEGAEESELELTCQAD